MPKRGDELVPYLCVACTLKIHPKCTLAEVDMREYVWRCECGCLKNKNGHF